MNISIIGFGRMSQHLAAGWQNAGHNVNIGSRQPEARKDNAGNIPVVSHEQALNSADVIVLAMPYTTVATFAGDHAEQLRNKLVIDISNPFNHLPDNRISGAEITAEAIGEGARVVAAFKANFWQTLLHPIDTTTGLKRDVHFAGDHANDKAIVSQLISDLGFQPVDCGALRNCRILDGMVPLLVELDARYGGGQTHSWKLLG